MLNSHCNNNNKNIFKKIMRPAGRESTIHGLKDHRATHYATESGVRIVILKL